MVNGSVPVACSIRVRLSDRRTFPPRPNPRDRNRRNRPRCTGTTTKRTIITSRTTIRMTNRVTEAKRGRVRVEQVAPLSGSGRRDIRSVVVPPSSTELPAPCVGERFEDRAFSFICTVPPDRPPPRWFFSSTILPTPRSLGPLVDSVQGVKTPRQLFVSFPFYIYSTVRAHVNLFPSLLRYVGFLELLSCIYIPANVKPVQCYRSLPLSENRARIHEFPRSILCEDKVS